MRHFANHVAGAIGISLADSTPDKKAHQLRFKAFASSTMSDKQKRSIAGVYLKALAALGPSWAIQRAKLLLLNRLGIIERRTPLCPWSCVSLSRILKPGIPAQAMQYFEWRQTHSPACFFSKLSVIKDALIVGGSNRAAEGILHGTFPFFGSELDLGFPPDWQRDPTTGKQAPVGHWSSLDELAFGDVKLWWEASRFSWVFQLARAFARTGDERYPQAFWQLVSNWMEQNPPNWGINWKCGQEASFRAMALCFGLYAFLSAQSTSAAQIERLVILIHALGQRIDAYTEYARSQKNNHGISEATGLWTIGLLFPELENAERWRTRGKQLIMSEVRRQLYDDGSYLQHSINYHRVMLQDLCWALRLGECNGDRLAPDIYERFRKATRFLHALTDSESGWAPNYGANDGALVTPLTDCTFPDMRPVLQSSNYLTEGTRLYPPGPWDEEMIWLNGPESANAPAAAAPNRPSDFAAESGGYYIIGAGTSWAMIRAAQYRDRPSHADQLHFDLWWRGENVLCDAGTYSYNSPFPFDRGLASTEYHNTATVNCMDQMTRVSRFLWADWANATILHRHSGANEPMKFQAEHSGYAKAGVIHRRAVIQFDVDTWIVVDDLVGRGRHTARLHWLAPDSPVDVPQPGVVKMKHRVGNMMLTAGASGGQYSFDVVRAGERVSGQNPEPADPARGWISRYYAKKSPALSMALVCSSELPLRFITVIVLGNDSDVRIEPSFRLVSVGTTSVELSTIGKSPITAQQ